jgi:hypothetical protein
MSLNLSFYMLSPSLDLGRKAIGGQTASLPIDHEIFLPLGAVTPPSGQPAVVVPTASRRHGENVAVN